MKRTTLMLVFLLALGSSLPLAAQWDLRLEIPAAHGNDLPSVLISGSTDLYKGDFDAGKGYIATVSRNFIDWGLISLDGNLEYSRMNSNGKYTKLQTILLSKVKQEGIGLGLNAHVWVPFFGIAGEFGVIQRLHSYDIVLGVDKNKENLSRTWMRVGGRWKVPIVPVDAYVCASFQQPLNSKNPVQISSAQSLLNLLQTQGAGQEFDRLWTFGVGVRF